MHRQNTYIAAAFALALTVGACAGVGRPAISPEPPTVAGVSTSGLELGVALHVDNPNPFALVANGVEGTLYLGGDKRVGTGSAQLDQPIAAKSQGTVESKLEIAWSSVGALKQFLGKSEVPYTFKGELGVKGGPLSLSVPFELRGHLTREQLLAVGSGALSPLLGR